MKRNLLAIGLIAVSLQAKAQKSDLVYVGNKSQFYVGTSSLVYSGGNLTLDSDMKETVMNHGNIKIVGDYKKGTRIVDAAKDGQEFVNFYDKKTEGGREVITYGQVQLLEGDGTRTTGRMTTERPAVSTGYFGASYAISFPYEEKEASVGVNYLMKSFGLEPNDFKGECQKDTKCGARYLQTLTKWNNSKIHHDAVVKGEELKAGDHYNLNLREVSMQDVMTNATADVNGLKKVGYKGKPAPQTYTQTAKGIIAGKDEKSFGEMGYNAWKNIINPYNEYYKSYMGDVNSNNKVLYKNIYRFGNPFTSNLDLSNIGGSTSWVKIKNLSVGEKTLEEAIKGNMLLAHITKRTDAYAIRWNAVTGNTPTNSVYKAVFNGRQWTGDANALLIQPTEIFYLTFNGVDTQYLPNRIVEVEVTFNDSHKTFAYKPSAETAENSGTRVNPGLSTASYSATPMTLAKKVSNANNVSQKVDTYNFIQAEIFLVKGDDIVASPVYLVGANYNQESANTLNSNSAIYVYGVKDGEVVYSSKKEFNEFNSLTYVGKPLGLGFNNLSEGENYELRFNLYENSIFNEVNNISEGSFYIKDNANNKVTEISADKSFAFTANGDMGKRFEIYWKEAPIGTLANDDVVVKADKTTIYTDNSVKKVRFEKVVNKANVEIYDMSGRLVSSEKNVNTSVDYTLNIATSSVYVVKVIYANGEVRTLKTTTN